MLETVTLLVNSGTIKPPIWEYRAGASNWVAVMRPTVDDFNPTRDFINGALDDHGCISVSLLAVGSAIEFGADYICDGPRGGKNSKRTKNRWYGVLRSVGKKSVVLDRYESAESAILATDAARARAQGIGEPNEKLQALREKLLDEKLRIEREILAVSILLGIDELLGIGPPMEQWQ